MRKRIYTILLLLAALLLAGCGKADALTEGRWQRVEYLSAEAAEDFLRALDFTEEELALADLTALGTVRQVEFTPEGSYTFSCDAAATRALARAYLDGFLTALTAEPSVLAAVYGEDVAAMTAEECRGFYAQLFGCADYEELTDHLADALFDYEALAAWNESGHYDAQGSRLSFTGPDSTDRGDVGFTLTADSLTLTYGSTAEEYRNVK